MGEGRKEESPGGLAEPLQEVLRAVLLIAQGVALAMALGGEVEDP